MRLVSVQGLGVQGLIVQPENLQKIAGRLPVTLLVNVVTQIVVGLCLGLATHDVDVNPNPGLAPV